MHVEMSSLYRKTYSAGVFPKPVFGNGQSLVMVIIFIGSQYMYLSLHCVCVSRRKGHRHSQFGFRLLQFSPKEIGKHFFNSILFIEYAMFSGPVAQVR